MPHFFVDRPLLPGRDVELGGEEAHHIARSLRLRAGDWLQLSDGAGRTYRATLTAVSAKRVVAHVEEEIAQRAAAPAPALALALARRTRFEWALEKAVELGCPHILPFTSERTVVAPRDAAAKRRRWEGIALAAAKQSGLPVRPQVDAPRPFAELLLECPRFTPRVLLYEGERDRDLGAALAAPHAPDARALLIVGPEGGFAPHEVAAAREAGVLTAGLGAQILRVETAAIASVAIWQYGRGNLEPAPA